MFIWQCIFKFRYRDLNKGVFTLYDLNILKNINSCIKQKYNFIPVVFNFRPTEVIMQIYY